MSKQLMALPVSALLLSLLVSLAAVTPGASHVARAQQPPRSTIDLMALDTKTEGNTATSLGEIDSCTRTEVGSEVTVDVAVDAIPQDRPTLGFEMHIMYDAKLLKVVEVDNDFLLGAVGDYQPFPGLSDPLPDSDGDLLILIVDMASNTTPGANMESGPGVLSRITFRADAAGAAELSLGFDPPDVYPAVIDNTSNAIGVNRLGSATLMVGADCPSGQPAPTPVLLPPIETLITPEATGSPGASLAEGTPQVQTPAPASATPGPGETPAPSPAGAPQAEAEGSDGSPTALIIVTVVVAAVAVISAAGGGFALYRRRQGRP